MASARKLLVPGTIGSLAPGVERIVAQQGYEAVYLGDITPEDIDRGLAHIDNDICVPTIAIVGQYMRYFEKHGVEEGISVLAPEMCRDCRSVSTPSVLPYAFERAGIESVGIVAFSSAESRSAAASPIDAVIAQDRPVIGVCGNMPIITTDEFRHVVCAHLEEKAPMSIRVFSRLNRNMKAALIGRETKSQKRGISKAVVSRYHPRRANFVPPHISARMTSETSSSERTSMALFSLTWRAGIRSTT